MALRLDYQPIVRLWKGVSARFRSMLKSSFLLSLFTLGYRYTSFGHSRCAETIKKASFRAIAQTVENKQK